MFNQTIIFVVGCNTGFSQPNDSWKDDLPLLNDSFVNGPLL